jgi:colanic acid biosynthesis glycosyl transferase WcaI
MNEKPNAQNKKRILIHSLFFKPEMTGISKYSGEMADWLVDNGFDCTVITAFPFYPYWKIQEPYTNRWYRKETEGNGAMTIYRCPLYVPANPTGMKRIIHEGTFLFTSFFIFFKLLFSKKFDLIISVAPPFHLAFAAFFYRLFKGTKVIYHIQDLQVDMAREMNMIKSNGLLSLLEKLEKYVLKSADEVSTISEGMTLRIKKKVDRSILNFPNWANIEQYYPLDDRNELKKEWGFLPTDKIVLYSGSIGEKQGLDQIIRVAEKSRANTVIKYVICGTGGYKETLIGLAAASNLDNVLFLPLQSNESFNRFLNMADLHLIIQKKDAGDLVMPSKLTTMLAIGAVVLATANPNTSLYNVLHHHGVGIVVEPENNEALYEAILANVDHDDLERRKHVRNYAISNISLDGIMKSFLEQVKL